MANINTIKITQLQNIGANLNGNTLFPVVSTVGSNVTDKANLATIATFILGEAGNLLPQAFVSTFSQTVVNAAQPNITSVGTLSALELNDIGTFNIPGGNNGDFLQTNGNGTLSWSAAPGSGNGSPGGANSQIQFNNNGLFGGDTGLTYNQGTDTLTTVNILASNINVATKLTTVNLSSTGNLIAANITTNNFTTNNFTTTGNLTANYFIGDGSQLTGITANASAGGSNGDVQFNSNGAVSGNNTFTYDEANSVLGVNNVLATNIQVTSVATLTDVNFTGNIQSGNLVSANYLAGDGSNITNIGNVNYANSANTANTAGVANSVAVANVVGIGNIATVALNGNGNQFLRGNGTWGNAGGGIQSQIANGTSNVNIPTSSGAVEVTAGTQHWAFGTDGTLTAPNDSQIVPAGNNFNIYTNGVNGAVQFFTDVTGNNHNWAFDGYGYTQLPFSQGYTNTAVITTVGAGNLMLQAGSGPTQDYLFGSDGTLTVPQNIHGSGALQLQGLANGNTTINIGSGVGGDIDMVSNLGNINLYTASNQPWIFDQGGNLTAPGAINVGNMSIGALPGYITADNNTGIIINVTGSDGGFVVDYLKEDGNANTSGGELAFSSELGNATYRISLSDDLGDGFATKIWRFAGTGTTSFPDNKIKTSRDNDLSIVTESLPTEPPTTIVISGADFVAVNLTYTKDGANSIWYPAGYNPATDPYIEFTGGQYGIFVPGFGQALYVNTGTLNVPLTQWSINPPLGSVPPTGVYTYPNTYTKTWTFGTDGTLLLPRDAAGNTDPYLWITGGNAPSISSVDVSLAGPANLQLVSDYLNLTGYTGAKVVVRADDGEIMADANMVLTTNAANVGNEFSWTFATDGSLTLPGNLISSGASPAPSISGFSSISTLVSLNTPVAYSSLTAIAGLRAFINDANLVAAGNFGQQVSGGGANSTPVWSDGTNWYIG